MTLLQALGQFKQAPTQESFAVTAENVRAINDLLESYGKGRVARVGHSVDLQNRVLWSNSTHGYAVRGTSRICGLR